MEQQLFFFLPDVMGGVASVVTNIVQYGGYTHKDRHIKVIAYNDSRDARAAIIFPITDQQTFCRFQYDSRRNFYYTVRRLRKIILAPAPIIVATDALEFEMVRLTGLDAKLVFIVLGDFEHYYGLAKKYQPLINGFIAISNEIYNKLITLFPHRKEDIHLAYFPTPPVQHAKAVLSKAVLRVVFAARLEAGKNPLLLLQVNKILKEKGIKIEWTVVGDGPLAAAFKEMSLQLPEFFFAGMLSNADLHKLYLQQDVFILTSEMEGLPVSLIEAMKTGLVPVVSDIPGGIREIVEQGINGFLCKYNAPALFADCIERLATNAALYEELSLAARQSANKQFDAVINSKRYFDIIESISFSKGRKVFMKKMDNRLDRSWMPGILVKWLRNLRAD